jgi:hypothetical protein
MVQLTTVIPDMISMLLSVHELLLQLSIQHIFPLIHVSARGDSDD